MCNRDHARRRHTSNSIITQPLKTPRATCDLDRNGRASAQSTLGHCPKPQCFSSTAFYPAHGSGTNSPRRDSLKPA